ncbi:MAG: UTP--glucose-1-phosphate uridylyltransferase GalU [Actinomycetota bacterium]|nr:UTP--glucose-1-phosphate uridylyltransferase GalU [Actinomycetota bacterium]
MRVRKAVIPAAGLGTRLLPASKSVPKEMIPLVDRPAIQYVVEECVRAGIRDVLIVTGRGKATMEDHFDRSLELEERLEKSGRVDELEEVRRVAAMADVHYVRQKEALGLGHAVGTARAHVGDEPFAVLLPDEIVPAPLGDEPPLLQRMIEVHEREGASVVAVRRVPRDRVSAYGIVAPEGELEDDFVKVSDFVEKPATAEAPSDLAAVGRYVLAPEVFDAIDATTPGAGGEIQLTDGIRALVGSPGVYAYLHRGPIYDVGKRLDYLKGTVQLALRRDDVGPALKAWLREVLES